MRLFSLSTETPLLSGWKGGNGKLAGRALMLNVTQRVVDRAIHDGLQIVHVIHQHNAFRNLSQHHISYMYRYTSILSVPFCFVFTEVA